MSKPYRVCPDCGSNLDPGERCDCKEHAELEPSKSSAELAARPATVDKHEPALMFGA